MGPRPHRAQGDQIADFLLVDDPGPVGAWAPLIEVLEGRGHRALALPASQESALAESVVPGWSILVGFGAAGLAVRAFADRHPDTARGLGTIASPSDPRLVVPGGELRVAIVCEGDVVVDYDEQRRAAFEWRAQPASVPGGHDARRAHPALVATLLVNWLAPEAI